MPSRPSYGFATGSVLLLAMVVVLLSVSLGAFAYTQLLAAQASLHSEDAVLLAESAINEVISQLSTTNGHFGTATTDSLTVQPDPTDAARTATVTFKPASTLPWSTNNLAGSLTTASIGFGGLPVPPLYARLIATGTSHGLTRHVEAIVYPFQFPYALACGGALDTDNLAVTEAGSLTYFVSSNGVPNPHGITSVAYLGATQLAPPSMTIDGALYYLDTGGGVNLPPGGSLHQSRAVTNLELPAIDIPTILSNAQAAITAIGTVPDPYSGALAAGPGYFTSTLDPAPSNGLTMNNCILSVGPSSMTVSGGDLQLNDAVLYVQGPLTVHGNLALNHGLVYVTGGNVSVTGAISGGGAVITDSSVSFSGMTNPDFATEVAVVANGAVSMNPNGPQSFFQGMLYSATQLNVNGTPDNQMLLGGVFLSLGGVTTQNTLISMIPECASLRYATWQPAAAPSFGDINQMGTTPTFQALDAQPSVAGSSFSASEVSTIYSAVNTLAAASPPYAAQVSGGIDPLAAVNFAPSYSLTAEPAFYDSCMARYVVPNGSTKYTSGGSGVPQASFAQVAQSHGTNVQITRAMLVAAQGLARLSANQQLSNDETTALSAGFNGLPVALGAERVSLNLAQWLKKTAGQPSYGVVTWRTF